MQNEPRKFIDFIITQNCTYRCPYCSQSKLFANDKQNASDDTIEAFYEFLKTLDNDFEITITGGEAILHPRFFEIIQKIKELGFRIDLITNLSFNIKTYQKIFSLLDDKLNRFDISFHLNQIQNFNLSLEKFEDFIKTKPKNTKTTVFIPLYLVDDKYSSKVDKLIKVAKKYDIEYSFQKIRFLNSYKKEVQEKYVSKHFVNKTFGNLCYAGNLSAVIYEDGSVYRCYSSRFTKSNYLGNIKDYNFKLNNEAFPCCKNVCTCPKPNAYNQILQEKDIESAIKQRISNIFHLPKMMFLKREIAFQKLRHFLHLGKS